MKNNFVAIVDYSLGNLFSIQQACKKVGLEAVITSSGQQILDSSAIILAGVGAFNRAMEVLAEKKLIDVLHSYISSGKPVVGICLGMQILLSESHEFGIHAGLNTIKGKVLRLKETSEKQQVSKVPHMGWNRIHSLPAAADSWEGTLLEGIASGAQMYFVHSYFADPLDKNVVLSKTEYGDNEFCSSLTFRNISAFQFHPECSGPNGLKIYRNLANLISKDGSVKSSMKRVDVTTDDTDIYKNFKGEGICVYPEEKEWNRINADIHR